jgi:sugar phosphate isomerase/epimerase
MTGQTLIYHPLASKHSTLAIDLAIVRAIGFDGLEASAAKMRDFLAAGYTEAELAALLRDTFIPGTGFLIDIERQGDGEATLLREAEALFNLAQVAGAKAVQVLTGPVQVEAVIKHAQGVRSGLYEGVLGRPRSEQIAITAGNLAKLADMAAGYGLLLYLESLAWSPLNTIADQVTLIEAAGRDNVRMVIDFWHCYASGETPDTVARLDPKLIYGVHICDSLKLEAGIPIETILRDVPTGAGVLDLETWTEAVKATGYVGWWSCELFCRKQHQSDSFDVARGLHTLMSALVLGRVRHQGSIEARTE